MYMLLQQFYSVRALALVWRMPLPKNMTVIALIKSGNWLGSTDTRRCMGTLWTWIINRFSALSSLVRTLAKALQQHAEVGNREIATIPSGIAHRCFCAWLYIESSQVALSRPFLPWTQMGLEMFFKHCKAFSCWWRGILWPLVITICTCRLPRVCNRNPF